jgi:regulator of Ty1 transposition protein 103
MNLNIFKEYTAKLQKIKEVQNEVKNHLENLPDIINLPDVTGGLAALPSAADLFNVHH